MYNTIQIVAGGGGFVLHKAKEGGWAKVQGHKGHEEDTTDTMDACMTLCTLYTLCVCRVPVFIPPEVAGKRPVKLGEVSGPALNFTA